MFKLCYVQASNTFTIIIGEVLEIAVRIASLQYDEVAADACPNCRVDRIG